ncbi:polyprotein [Plakobranchus ocellatus]|uniref:Polyprotein n=1 Tax=Plakobranchus ocellatus TaxID=259542 RepID=A0AAV3Z1N0_9GAST|nr:polyprotein [Plakobranchus ocellatus]
MVVLEKPNEALQICVDPRDLNKAIQREHFSIPSPDEITAKMSGAKFFSKFDAASGFWQILLDQESCQLCTFENHLGDIRFCDTPLILAQHQKYLSKGWKKYTVIKKV